MNLMGEVGINYATFKAQSLNVAKLNDAFLPFSAPDQTPTRSMTDVLRGLAHNSSIVQQYSDAFHINSMGMIPLTTAAQANPNVEIPTMSSVRGDKNASLAKYPRVYVDRKSESSQFAYPYSSWKNSLAAGMPTESETSNVPGTGLLNRAYNPWGPGGIVQVLTGQGQEMTTRQKHTNQSRLLLSPQNPYTLDSMKNRNF